MYVIHAYLKNRRNITVGLHYVSTISQVLGQALREGPKAFNKLPALCTTSCKPILGFCPSLTLIWGGPKLGNRGIMYAYW